jgi:hypothetical protein
MPSKDVVNQHLFKPSSEVGECVVGKIDLEKSEACSTLRKLTAGKKAQSESLGQKSGHKKESQVDTKYLDVEHSEGQRLRKQAFGIDVAKLELCICFTFIEEITLAFKSKVEFFGTSPIELERLIKWCEASLIGIGFEVKVFARKNFNLELI